MSTEQDQIRSLAQRVARRLTETAGERAPANSHGAPNAGERHAGDSLTGDGDAELTALRRQLAEIQRRLAHLESHVTHDEQCAPEPSEEQFDRQGKSPARGSVSASRSPWLSGTYISAVHPSDERFGVGEAVSELVDYFERDKVCTLEPGGKPCDHCGICSARGF